MPTRMSTRAHVRPLACDACLGADSVDLSAVPVLDRELGDAEELVAQVPRLADQLPSEEHTPATGQVYVITMITNMTDPCR